MRKVLLIATYDSFLNAGVEVAKNIENATVDIYIRKTKLNQLSDRQLSNIPNEYQINYFLFNKYKQIKFEKYDVIIISVANSVARVMISFLQKKKVTIGCNYIIISLFPGIIFGDIDSITSRIDSDILLCNNKYDTDIAKGIVTEYKLNTIVINYGFPQLQIIKKDNFRNSIYFIDQVKTPYDKRERLYILKQLIFLAMKFPEYNFFIKARVKKREVTVHNNLYPFEDLLKEIENIPNNFKITYVSTYECLKSAKLIIGINSTLLFESIANNIPTISLKVFGIRDNFYNKYFLNSGILYTFDEIDKMLLKDKIILEINNDFLNSFITYDSSRGEDLCKIINERILHKKEKVLYNNQIIKFNNKKIINLSSILKTLINIYYFFKSKI